MGEVALIFPCEDGFTSCLECKDSYGKELMIKGEESRFLPLKDSYMKFLILTSE